MSQNSTRMVMLNVGGVKVCTTLTTLGIQGPNFLTQLVENDAQGKTKAYRDCEGYIFIDRNGKTFEVVLDYLRNNVLEIPPGITRRQVELEFDFYQIPYRKPPEFITQAETVILQFVDSWLDENEQELIKRYSLKAQEQMQKLSAEPLKIEFTAPHDDGSDTWKITPDSTPFPLKLIRSGVLAETMKRRWLCDCNWTCIYSSYGYYISATAQLFSSYYCSTTTKILSLLKDITDPFSPNTKAVSVNNIN